MKKELLGEFEVLQSCRFCDSKDLQVVLDLGLMPLAGAFLKEDEIWDERFYPLELQFCCNCCMVQVSCVPDPKDLFNEKYFFHSSSVLSLVRHFEDYATDVFFKFLADRHDPVVLEVGCNDGVLLRPLAKLGCKVIGVDPSINATSKISIENAEIFNEFFGEKVASDIVGTVGAVDLVTANFSFGHIDDMHDVMKGVNLLLKPDGIFVFEIYYLKTILDEMNYDMIYHEHMSYYSLLALSTFLEKWSIEIFDVDYFSKIRSGALRVYCKNKENKVHPISNRFKVMLKNEYDSRLNTISPFIDYSIRIDKTKSDLLSVLLKLRSEGKSIVGYGASGRSTVVMNYCGINNSHLDCIVDDAVEKQGFITPGSHLKIVSWENMEERFKPDYIVLFAWSFVDEVLERRSKFRENGGRFIIPLPSVRII
jgi:methylation protein EvaC